MGGNTQTMILSRALRGDPDSETLVKIKGLDVALTVGEDSPQFPHRPGPRVDVRVYNLIDDKDVDGDWTKWYFNFITTSVQIIDSDIYIIGYSRPDEGFGGDVDGYTCEDGHLPWQHDGACAVIEHYSYSGLVELRLYFGKEFLDPEWECHSVLESLNGHES